MSALSAGEMNALQTFVGRCGVQVEWTAELVTLVAGILDAREAAWRGERDGLRARVEALADWCAAKGADHAGYRDEYAEGARDAYDVAESRLRAVLSASQTSAGVTTPGSDDKPAERRTEPREQDPHTDWPTSEEQR